MNIARRAPLFVLAVSVSLCACSGDADFSAVAPTPVTLNADEYRKEISDIDRLVFEERPLTDERRETLAGKLEELAKRVKTSSDSRYIAIEALELRRFASGTKNLPPDASLTALQDDWMRIRNNLFDDRSWFVRSAADLEPPLPAVSRPLR